MKEDVYLAILAHDAIQRQGLLSILQAGGFSNVQAFDDMGALCSANFPDDKRILFLLDIHHSGQFPSDICQTARARHENSLVVLLADEYRDALVAQALKWEADSLLLSNVAPEVLIKALELVLLGERVFPATTILKICNASASNVQDHHEVDARELLSAREVEVLRRVTAGQANKVIARDCGITESTVKVHVRAILRKIKAKNRTQAAIWARRNGVCDATAPLHEKIDLHKPLL